MSIRDLQSKFTFLRTRRAARTTRVFISYTGRHPADEELTRKIYDLLRGYDVSVFVAPLSIEAGSDWRAVLRREIAACSHFVLIVSEASMRSEEVNAEIQLVCHGPRRRGELTVVPILYGRASTNPFGALQAIHYRNYSAFTPIELTGHDDFRQLSDRLLAVIGVPGQIRRGPAAGRVVPLLCDREEQEDAVDAVLAELSSPSDCTPVAFFVGGLEDDNPDSFIERIIVTKLDGLAGGARPPRIRIPWRGGWTERSGPRALRALLFQKLGFPDDDHSSAVFAAKLATLPHSVIVLTHTLHADEFHLVETTAVLNDYLQFWEMAAKAERKPFFILFFQILYSPAGQTPAPSSAAIRNALNRTIARRQNVRTALLRDFPCIREKHVYRWFVDYAGGVPERQRMERIAAIFATSGCQRMEVVESALRRIQADLMETS